MKQMMDAIVKPTAGPGLELRQVPVPVPGPGEVLIKIHKTAICGSDVHIYKWNQWAQQHVKPPQVIGHEYVGEVAELGAGVTGFTVGQRVSGEGHITCGHCRNCHTGNIQWCKHHVGVGVDRDGAFAEYVCIPSRNVIAIDESLMSSSGVDLCMAIRGRYPGMTRIVMTNAPTREIVDARSHGVIDGYVVKPVSASTLLAQIRSSRKE